MRESGIVRQEFALGLARGEEFENEFHSQTRSTNHWFACQDLRIHDDTLGNRHTYSLACQRSGQRAAPP